jgi:arsenical pump membrane protein
MTDAPDAAPAGRSGATAISGTTATAHYDHPVMWAIAGVAGALCVLTGLLPRHDAYEVAISRGGPVLGFLAAITVLAELTDRAGVFEAAAGWCGRAARGSTVRWFLLVAVLGSATTVAMSLDTTAVLLTPVVLSLATRLGLRPLPFALLAVWIANTASLLLPVSNLTNLLAVQREALSTLEFARRMALPEVIAVGLTVCFLGLLYRRDLRGRYEPPAAEPPRDAVTFWVCATACVAIAPAVLAGAPPWAIATGSAVVVLAVTLVRDRAALAWSLLPWRLIVLTTGLFLVVATIAKHGGTALIAKLVGTHTLATAAVGAGASNLVNNLPTYLAIEPAVPPGNTTQLLSALVGTNTGPLILLWGSLATLLWRERCKARGVDVSVRTFALVGLGGVPLIVAATWAGLLVTS